MPLGSSAADKKCLYSNPTGVQTRNPPHTHDVTIDTAQYGKNASVALAVNLPSSTPVRVDHGPLVFFFSTSDSCRQVQRQLLAALSHMMYLKIGG